MYINYYLELSTKQKISRSTILENAQVLND